MEMQWNSTPWSCFKRCANPVLNQEQTLEVRLSDGMPDIARVLCAWGQPILRGKEWRNEGISVTGGVAVWVLYIPEEGELVQSVQAWLPFQGKWSLTDSHRDGFIRAECILRGVDARTLSARKLMVRANVGLVADTWEQTQTDIAQPQQMPQQVYALEKTYPLWVWTEAGEKLLTLEESFSTDGTKLLSCRIRPVVTEQNVVGERVVIRGVAYADALCLDEQGKVFSRTFELPFAQFADLEGKYDKDSAAEISVAVSNLETELIDSVLRIKCGLVAQYLIRENRMLRIAEDAYSPLRALSVDMQPLCIPTVLDQRREWVELEEDLSFSVAEVVDVCHFPDHPVVCREGTQTVLEFPGMVSALWYDGQGELHASSERICGTLQFPAGEDSKVYASVTQESGMTLMPHGGGTRLSGRIRLDTVTAGQLQTEMVTAMKVGEAIARSEDSPSLLLQRVGEEDLWQLAKASGSTVEAIREANGLENEPIPGALLLIPVI